MVRSSVRKCGDMRGTERTKESDAQEGIGTAEGVEINEARDGNWQTETNKPLYVESRTMWRNQTTYARDYRISRVRELSRCQWWSILTADGRLKFSRDRG